MGEEKSRKDEDPFHVKTRFGRKRRLGLVRGTIIYLYEKYKDVYPLAYELARIEGISFSELVSRALKEYVEKHYPGNPQIQITSFTNSNFSKRFEAVLVAEDLKKHIEALRRVKEILRERPQSQTQAYFNELREKLKRETLRLIRLNELLREEKYNKLIEKAIDALGITNDLNDNKVKEG